MAFPSSHVARRNFLPLIPFSSLFFCLCAERLQALQFLESSANWWKMLGPKTWSQRHRLLQAPHRDVSASLWNCSRTSATHKVVFHSKLSCNMSFWPILQWEEEGACLWNFWGARTGLSGCFPFMNTEYSQIQILVGILSFSSLKPNMYLLFILRVDIEPNV